MRNLIILETNNGNYAQFIKYIQGKPQQVKRLITAKEAAKGKQIIAGGNESEIDLFCYSIS